MVLGSPENSNRPGVDAGSGHGRRALTKVDGSGALSIPGRFRSLLGTLPRMLLTLLLAIPAAGAAAQAPPPSVPSTQLRRFAQHDPKRRVIFTIALQESGGSGDYGWNMKGEARYALLPSWDGAHGVDPGLRVPLATKLKVGLQRFATAEDLFDYRGGFFNLKPGERLQFYIKEAKDEGKGWMPPPEKTHTWTTTVRDGVTTSTLDGDSSTRQEPYADQADATLVRTETGAKLHFRWYLDPGWSELGASASIFGFSSPEAARVLTFQLSDDDLRHWDRVSRSNAGSVHHPEDAAATATVSARLYASQIPDEVEVAVEPGSGYEDWLPKGNLDQPGQPGNRLQVNVKVTKPGDAEKPRKAKLTFTWTKVSMQKGVCINWPQGGSSDYDLKFLQEDNPDLEVPGPDEARSKGLVEDATLVISCFDYGAYGTLKITAKDADGKDLKVKVRGKEGSELKVPQDENDNHIGDAWERQNGVAGYPDNWDGAQAAGQKVQGDGLSLFEKYRGVVVLEGGERKWIRLEPREKVFFVIDPKDLVLADAWWKASQIRLYRLREDMVEPGGGEASRRVNHCTSDFSNGGKYAVVLSSKSTGDTAAILAKGGEVDLGETSIASRPAEITYCRVFPDHIRAGIQVLVNRVKNALGNYGTPRAGTLCQRFPKWMLEQAYARLQDPAVAESLYQQILKATAIHELGHACGLAGHVVGGKEGAVGDRNCFMRYSTLDEDRDFIVLETLFKSGAALPTYSGDFCRAGAEGGFDCFGKLNVKDN